MMGKMFDRVRVSSVKFDKYIGVQCKKCYMCPQWVYPIKINRTCSNIHSNLMKLMLKK